MKPKPSLRSSKDIYHRLKWGGGFPADRVWIGYMDRIEGMKEIPYVRFRPGGRIPWDRVWYFKLDGKLIWDRESRLDRVFGSGDTPEEEQIEYQAPKGGGFPAEFAEGEAWVFDEGIGGWRTVGSVEAGNVPGERPSKNGSSGKTDLQAGASQGGYSSRFIRQSRLRLVSYNVLRTDDHRPGLEHELRIPELIRELDGLDADVILLQEVQAPLWNKLLRMPWVRQSYYLSCGPELSPDKGMDEVILSKWPPSQVHSLRFSREKEASGMRFIINGHPFSIFTLHLPSDMARGSEDKRYRYIKELSHALPEGETVLIGGDFNFEEELPLPESYRDLWPLLRGEELGATFAPLENPLAGITGGEENTVQNGSDHRKTIHHKPTGDRRLDRIFLHDPTQRLLPHSIQLIGTEPKSRHGETIYLSDHYGLMVEIDLETTVATLQKVDTTHQGALVYIPPPSTWAEIQAIRRQYDNRFDSWMPHINLLYGFLPERYFRAAATMVRQAMSEEAFFQMDLRSFDQFHHGRSQTIWLKPDLGSEARWIEIQEILRELFPNCIEQDRYGTFTPHLSVGKISGRNAGRASRLREEWSDSWEGLEVDVGVLAMISRPENGPFEVKEVIPLGDESEWESFDPASWDLKTSLGALGLLPGSHHRAAAKRAEEYLFQVIRKIDPKAQLYSVGSFGLGVSGPESDFDFLCIGRVDREYFLRKAADELGGLDLMRQVETELVPVLEGSFEGRTIDLMYAAYPSEVPITRPSHLPTESFRHFEISSQMTLSASLEVAALRRFIGPDLSAFQTALLALKAWAKAHQIDQEAFGYPGGLGWTLMLAATPSEESPELWLQRCFELLVQHDWRQPLMPIEGFYPEDSAAMQVVTASSPARNVTRQVTPGTLAVLQEAFEEGLNAIWNIRQEGGRWVDFFGVKSEHGGLVEDNGGMIEDNGGAKDKHWFVIVERRGSIPSLRNGHHSGGIRGKAIAISIQGRDPKSLELVQSWVRRNFRSLLQGLEGIVHGIRPWPGFESEGGFAGKYLIGLRSYGDKASLRVVLKKWEQKYAAWSGRPGGGELSLILLNLIGAR